ncbi:MAG: DNA repair protein RecN [Pseudohongiellaceae bacterium]|nr:DNA repair protein RecN [Pseudohongiellaceae bacterium]
MISEPLGSGNDTHTMLTQLTIANYAIVDHLEIDFQPGMTAITGETGAGKSIILGALGLTLGDRSDKGVVSHGAKRADISALFNTSKLPHAQKWLDENELLIEDEPDTCLIRRVVGEDGRSKAWVNGFPVNLQVLKTIGEMLIDIHSQHEHQSLLNRATHQRQLDDFTANAGLAKEVRDLSRQWRSNNERMRALLEHSEETSAQAQLIRYQVNELDELSLEDGELEALDEEYSRLNSADTTLSTAQELLILCQEGEEQTLLGGINHALSVLQELRTKTSALNNVAELLGNASVQIEEAVADLRREIDQFDANPERLEQINQRLADIHSIARKHKVAPDQLPSLHAELQSQLEGLDNSDETIEALRQQDVALRKQYQEQASKLSKLRAKAAGELEQRINEQIASLGMSNASLKVALSPNNADSPAPGGLESVEFLVSTNPGQEPRPLIKIASGGELSRISLAIQVITAQTSATPTLVFDEVDVGIGGSVARSVGRLLRELGERGQVFCVTHQAQVASLGHQHLFVSKSAKAAGDKSFGTEITELRGEEQVKEIARMLGGESETQDFTPESLAHAQEMLSV